VKKTAEAITDTVFNIFHGNKKERIDKQTTRADAVAKKHGFNTFKEMKASNDLIKKGKIQVASQIQKVDTSPNLTPKSDTKIKNAISNHAKNITTSRNNVNNAIVDQNKSIRDNYVMKQESPAPIIHAPQTNTSIVNSETLVPMTSTNNLEKSYLDSMNFGGL